MAFFLICNGTPAAAESAEVPVPWWSFGKTVLAAAALTLVRDGLVGLDEPLPEGPFSLRQLLRHQAGLADYGELADYHAAVAGHAAPWPEDELLRRLDARRLRYAPGNGWRYSNIGYLYVARLIERLAGLPLDQGLTQRVLAPAGLRLVRLARRPADLYGVQLGAVATYHPGWVYHGLLVGPLAEAAQWLECLLAGELLPTPLLQEMQAAHALGAAIPGRPWAAPGYALGLVQGPARNGLACSGHTGGGPGSVLAAYRSVQGARTASCAVFHPGVDQAAVEEQVVARLSGAVGWAG